jgi:hypothetical protein
VVGAACPSRSYRAGLTAPLLVRSGTAGAVAQPYCVTTAVQRNWKWLSEIKCIMQTLINHLLHCVCGNIRMWHEPRRYTRQRPIVPYCSRITRLAFSGRLRFED